MQDVGLAGVVVAHPGAGLEGGHRGDIEYLATALCHHAGAEGVAKAGQGQDVEFDQLLFPRPFLVDEGAGGTDPGIVNQQVDLSFALFQFVQQP